jgi:hypothetical protein
MFYEPKHGHGLPHDPLKAIVAPRPIGWISTLDTQGRPNLAPYSFFNLGIANYYMGAYEEAEKVLAIVNLMDGTNALTWAYLTLSLLSKPQPPVNSAY